MREIATTMYQNIEGGGYYRMEKIVLLVLVGLFLTAGCIGDSDGIDGGSPDHPVEVAGHEHEEDHEHEYSVEVVGSEMRLMRVQEVADLWEIDSEELLDRIVLEFGFEGNYTTETVLEDMRSEYRFSPAAVKDIAEEIKAGGG